MLKKVCKIIGLWSFLLYAPLGWSQTIYIKPDEALKQVFKNSEKVSRESKQINPERKRALEKKLGTALKKTTWNFYIAKTGNTVDGYALLDQELGKTEPITVMTAIFPNGEVQEVEILVYREPIGSEVHEKSFLKQYKGKKITDPIRLNQDIIPISGATISSRSVSQAVKRALIIWSEFYGK